MLFFSRMRRGRERSKEGGVTLVEIMRERRTTFTCRETVGPGSVEPGPFDG
jgi:hypothetical protein